MKIEQLQQVVAIVKHGSISKAAKELFMAQSSLSASIRSLENELGGTLFDRSNKGIHLTPLGAELYHRAAAIYDQIQFIQQLTDGKNAPLSLTVSNMFNPVASEIFISMYKKYQQDNVKFSIKERTAPDIIKDVELGLSDIGVISLFSNTESLHKRMIQSKGLSYHPVAMRKLYVVTGPSSPLHRYKGDSIQLEELNDYAFASYYGAIWESTWEDIFTGLHRKKHDVTVSTVECLIQLLKESTAFTIDVVNSPVISGLPQFEGLRFIELSYRGLTCELGWIKSTQQTLNPLAKEYVQELTARLSPLAEEKQST